MLFFLAGIIIGNTVIERHNAITAADFGYLIVLFVAIIIIRGLMMLLFFPILQKVSDYGLHWKDATVAAWGGLRGAVGLGMFFCRG